MSDLTPTPQFEEEIRSAVATPAAREEFVKSLHARLAQQAASRSGVNRPFFRRPAWIAAFAIAVLVVSILLVGPQRVLAAMRGLFGYIPGVGIVDQSAPIWVLAEPVTVTRDEISITVTSAILTGDKTHIEYRIFGVPGSAYPDREDVMGCTTQEYLRLPDGTQLARIDNDYEPAPSGTDEATFIIPCIFNALPGKTPENWELLLRFVPAPPDLTVMPVIDVTLATRQAPTPSPSIEGVQETITPAPIQTIAVSVERVIETGNGYILVGAVRAQLGSGQSIQVWAPAVIRDANDQKVGYTYPQDIDEYELLYLEQGDQPFSFQIESAGLAFPLTIEIPGKIITPDETNATAEIVFDTGVAPLPGQEWLLNQEIDLAGHTFFLASITTDASNSYAFRFETDGEIAGLSVQIEGYTPVGGGGGGDGQGLINRSVSYTELPTGSLKIIFSGLMLASDTQFWQAQWTPETIRTDLPAIPTPQLGLCLTVDSLAQLQPAPADFANGTALFFEKLADTGTWGLALYNLDGSGRQVVTMNGNWGALSPDGNTVAYSAQDNGIHLVDVNSQADRALPNASGFNIHWSPDGAQIAYIGMGNGTINSAFIARVDGSQVHQVSDWSYETIIGWSPDSTQLYADPPADHRFGVPVPPQGGGVPQADFLQGLLEQRLRYLVEPAPFAGFLSDIEIGKVSDFTRNLIDVQCFATDHHKSHQAVVHKESITPVGVEKKFGHRKNIRRAVEAHAEPVRLHRGIQQDVKHLTVILLPDGPPGKNGRALWGTSIHFFFRFG
ncbi:MAG: hypothetical protein R6V75_00240 [Bacteroidales bacterium]